MLVELLTWEVKSLIEGELFEPGGSAVQASMRNFGNLLGCRETET